MTAVHVSGNSGTARRWVTDWDSTTCVILKSANFFSTATGSTHRIPVGTTCWRIAPSPEAIPPERWRNCVPCRSGNCTASIADSRDVDGGIGSDILRIERCRRKPTRLVNSCVRGGTRSVPKTSGSFPADSAARPVCVARSWQCSPASAPSTTYDSNGDAPNPSPQILDALARALKLDLKATMYLHQLASPTTSRWDQSVLEVAAEGLDRLIDQCPFPAIWPVDTKTSWRRIRWPGRCRQDSPRDRTSCAGAF